MPSHVAPSGCVLSSTARRSLDARDIVARLHDGRSCSRHKLDLSSLFTALKSPLSQSLMNTVQPVLRFIQQLSCACIVHA